MTAGVRVTTAEAAGATSATHAVIAKAPFACVCIQASVAQFRKRTEI
jgi:hypothetical protein